MSVIALKTPDRNKMSDPLFPALPKQRRVSRTAGAQMFILTICAGLVVFFAWAATAKIDALARASGQVIAVARTQVVQAADQGVLSEIFVREGEAVEKGALLVRMDQSRHSAAYEDSLNKVAALKAALTRLRAEVYGRELSFSAELEGWPAFRENQEQLFLRRQQALSEGLAALESTRAMAQAELNVTEPLLAAGDVGQIEILRLKRAIAEIDGQIVNTKNKYFQDAQTEMTRAEEELAAQEQLLRERAAVLSYTELRAPVDGLVKKISVTTPGASVRPGETILEMLPTGSELIVEAKYPPADVASLRLGLPASVKLDAYDASIYGDVDGEVIYISPDALSEPDPRTGAPAFYYRVHIRLSEPPQQAGPEKKPIIVNPGMTAMVEVRTRKRTVLSYLTKPVTKTLSQSFNER